MPDLFSITFPISGSLVQIPNGFLIKDIIVGPRILKAPGLGYIANIDQLSTGKDAIQMVLFIDQLPVLIEIKTHQDHTTNTVRYEGTGPLLPQKPQCTLYSFLDAEGEYSSFEVPNTYDLHGKFYKPGEMMIEYQTPDGAGFGQLTPIVESVSLTFDTSKVEIVRNATAGTGKIYQEGEEMLHVRKR